MLHVLVSQKHKYSASSVSECKTIADTHIIGIASPNYPTECNVYSDLKISEAIILESAESNEYSGNALNLMLGCMQFEMKEVPKEVSLVILSTISYSLISFSDIITTF